MGVRKILNYVNEKIDPLAVPIGVFMVLGSVIVLSYAVVPKMPKYFDDRQTSVGDSIEREDRLGRIRRVVGFPGSEEDVSDLSKNFDRVADADGDGDVSDDEMRETLKRMGYDTSSIRFREGIRISPVPDGSEGEEYGCPPGGLIGVDENRLNKYIEKNSKVSE